MQPNQTFFNLPTYTTNHFVYFFTERKKHDAEFRSRIFLPNSASTYRATQRIKSYRRVINSRIWSPSIQFPSSMIFFSLANRELSHDDHAPLDTLANERSISGSEYLFSIPLHCSIKAHRDNSSVEYPPLTWSNWYTTSASKTKHARNNDRG